MSVKRGARGAKKWAWAKLTKGKMAAASKGRLRTLAQEAADEGPRRSDGSYMKSATASGQAGQWAGVAPAFGTRVRSAATDVDVDLASLTVLPRWWPEGHTGMSLSERTYPIH